MTSLLELPQPLLDRQDALERALRKHVKQAAKSELPLYRMMEYQLGWLESDGSEATGPPPLRFHGALCLEAAASVAASGNGDATGAAGAAAELMHQSTAVHEEMQIAEMRTEQRPAVWWVWGPAQAINVGDGLHALARLAIFAMQERGQTAEHVLQAVGTLDAAALKYYEGQYLELTFQERLDITEAQYYKMALGKHGALVGGAMALGAVSVGASEGVVDAFRSFGEQLGVAVQIADDVSLVWGGDKARQGIGRVLNKTKTYPVVHALEHATIAQKRALGEVYFKRVMEPDDLEAIRKVLEEVGARDHARDRAREEAASGLRAIEAAGLGPDALDRWKTVVDGLIAS